MASSSEELDIESQESDNEDDSRDEPEGEESENDDEESSHQEDVKDRPDSGSSEYPESKPRKPKKVVVHNEEVKERENISADDGSINEPGRDRIELKHKRMSDIENNKQVSAEVSDEDSDDDEAGSDDGDIPEREFYLHDHERNKHFRSNYIKTTKYTLITFIPLSLFKQFLRIANIYFLVVAILASIPDISSINPATAIAPLVAVLAVSMIREGIEDYYRYKSDKASNSKVIERLGVDGEWEEVYSKDLRVGDIVCIYADDTFPADIILLKSSNGLKAFIQTSSLDGEKNLKKRFVPPGFDKVTKPLDEKSYHLGGKCTTLMPDKDLYQFGGKLEASNKNYALDSEQLLLKDSKLKNTSWIVGTVAFTGKDTKVMLNSQKGRIKTSNLERRLNNIIIWLFLIQVLICLALSIAMAIYDEVKDDDQDEYLGDDNSTESPYLNFFSYFLLLSTLIPISLIVTLEIVKVIQCYFIAQDTNMYSIEHDRGVKVSATTINEELGQVTYIFSDKTGTLTQNIMEFRALAVGEEMYGEIGSQGIQRQSSRVEKKKELQENFRSRKLERVLSDEHPKDNAHPKIITSSNGKAKKKFRNDQEEVQEIIKLLSICHDCEAEEAVVDDEKILFYQGASPDEVTLVDFAKSQGFEFIKCENSETLINLYPDSGMTDKEHDSKTYKIHRKIPFDSTRKRMSVLFTDPDDGLIKLYSKGADSIIKERLSQTQTDEKIMDHIDDFLSKSSVLGLRTLLMAMRVIHEDEFEAIKREISSAERDVKNRDKLLADIFENFEKDLVLIGATAVEDKLQDNVPQTLEDFRRADIKVWMLTGDKLETAKNIGYSCKLLTDEMVIFQAQGGEEAEKVFTKELVDSNEHMMKDMKKRAVVLDAQALSFLTTHPNSLQHFINVAKSCNAVICSRASPAQKAEVVRLIKNDDPSNITLAVGDGANDVSMILEADIGIGLYGKEGMRAAQASDFALHQFKFLWDLILFHGRYNYLRNAELILYFFYKNIIFTLPQIYFAYSSDFSAQTIFDDWYISFYNMFFTALPIIVKSIFETDVNYKIYKDNRYDIVKEYLPRLYYVGRRETVFTYWTYTIWVIDAIWHSLMSFLITYFVFQTLVMDEDGKNSDLWSFSVCLFFSILIIATIRICVTERVFNIFNFLAIIVCSLLLYYIYNWASNFIFYSKTYLTSEQLHVSPIFYLTIFICSGIVLVTDLVVMVMIVELFGSPTNFMRIILNKYKEIPDYFYPMFERLMKNQDKNFINQDLKRERYIQKRRVGRMKKLEEKLENDREKARLKAQQMIRN